MLRKTTAAVVLLAALALGTASATSLGTFDDIAFAASDVTLDTCVVSTTSGLIDLVPDIPEVGDVVGSASVPLDGTILVDALDLTDLVTELGTLADCAGDIADLTLIGDHDLDVLTADQVMGLAEGINLDTPASYSAVNLVDGAGAPVILDIAKVKELRVVVSNS